MRAPENFQAPAVRASKMGDESAAASADSAAAAKRDRIEHLLAKLSKLEARAHSIARAPPSGSVNSTEFAAAAGRASQRAGLGEDEGAAWAEEEAGEMSATAAGMARATQVNRRNDHGSGPLRFDRNAAIPSKDDEATAAFTRLTFSSSNGAQMPAASPTTSGGLGEEEPLRASAVSSAGAAVTGSASEPGTRAEMGRDRGSSSCPQRPRWEEARRPQSAHHPQPAPRPREAAQYKDDFSAEAMAHAAEEDFRVAMRAIGVDVPPSPAAAPPSRPRASPKQPARLDPETAALADRFIEQHFIETDVVADVLAEDSYTGLAVYGVASGGLLDMAATTILTRAADAEKEQRRAKEKAEAAAAEAAAKAAAGAASLLAEELEASDLLAEPLAMSLAAEDSASTDRETPLHRTTAAASTTQFALPAKAEAVVDRWREESPPRSARAVPGRLSPGSLQRQLLAEMHLHETLVASQLGVAELEAAEREMRQADEQAQRLAAQEAEASERRAFEQMLLHEQRCDEAMLDTMLEMEQRVAMATAQAHAEAAQTVEAAADLLEVQAHEAKRALE